ncbi:hypothetical protein GCM10023085_40590 [Actinomadura viridis]
MPLPLDPDEEFRDLRRYPAGPRPIGDVLRQFTAKALVRAPERGFPAAADALQNPVFSAN